MSLLFLWYLIKWIDHERCANNPKSIILKLIIQNYRLSDNCCEVAVRWIPYHIINAKSALICAFAVKQKSINEEILIKIYVAILRH